MKHGGHGGNDFRRNFLLYTAHLVLSKIMISGRLLRVRYIDWIVEILRENLLKNGVGDRKAVINLKWVFGETAFENAK
jgi:hypothetical protein